MTLCASVFRYWRVLAAFVAFSCVAAGAAQAQEGADIIRGRVTDVAGKPIVKATVEVIDSIGRIRETTTNKDGRYTAIFRDGIGVYRVRVTAVGRQPRQVTVRRAADEAVLIADVQLQPLAPPQGMRVRPVTGGNATGRVGLDTVRVSAQRRPKATRESTMMPGVGVAEERFLGLGGFDGAGDLMTLAGSLPGVTMTPDGFSVLGAGADQNRMTLNGMQFALDQLPRNAIVSGALTTTTFDPSRGGFSGGELSMNLLPGSNQINRWGTIYLAAPPLQFVDAAGRQLGQQYTNIDVAWRGTGPIIRNSMYYNLSLQAGRRFNDLQVLALDRADALQRMGVAPDSVARLFATMDALGIPLAPGNPPSHSATTVFSGLSQVDYVPSTSNRTIRITGGWNARRNTGSMLSSSSVLARGGTGNQYGVSLSAAYSSYVKDAFLNDMQMSLSVTRNRSTPYFSLPDGRVRVLSQLPDGTEGQTTLMFGGNASLTNESSSWMWEVRNEMSWFSLDSKHRLKLAFNAQVNGMSQTQLANPYGAYSYLSLADLAAGAPASFTRTFGNRDLSAAGWQFFASLGDAWRARPDLQIQYGVRLEGNRYLSAPPYNPQVDTEFGVRTDRVPNSVHLSPRAGFTWLVRKRKMQTVNESYGSIVQIGGGPAYTIRGGIGEFRGPLSPTLVASYMSSAGLPDNRRQLMCLGDNVPAPAWDAFLNDLSTVPDVCLNGEVPTPFAFSAPAVQLFASSYTAPRSWRANLSVDKPLWMFWTVSVQNVVSFNIKQSRAIDRNFAGVMQFTLPDENERPVFVPVASVVPGSGAVSSADTRISADFLRVMEMRSDLRSWANEFSVRLNRFAFNSRYGGSVGYNLSHQRAQVGGWTSAAGSPEEIAWARGMASRHQLYGSVSLLMIPRTTLSLSGSARSGMAYTPLVAGDINGDGSANDRAFIPNPATSTDAALAAGFESLLQQAPAAARECLRKQMGTVAQYNSCTGPWSYSLNARLSITLTKLHGMSRNLLSISMSNVLGGLDQLIHGSNGMRGWGTTAMPQSVLFTPRAFDPATRRFTYEVNPRFGETRASRSVYRSPFNITVSLSLALAPPSDVQTLMGMAERGGTQTLEQRKASLERDLVNRQSFRTILTLRDSLMLTAEQFTAIETLLRAHITQIDSLWMPVVERLAALGKDLHPKQEIHVLREARERQMALAAAYGIKLREILSPEQWQLLPGYVREPFEAPRR